MRREEVEEEKTAERLTETDASEKARGSQRVGRGARKERERRWKGSTKRARSGRERGGGEANASVDRLEGFACSCIDRRLGSAVHLHPLASRRRCHCCRSPRHPSPLPPSLLPLPHPYPRSETNPCFSDTSPWLVLCFTLFSLSLLTLSLPFSVSIPFVLCVPLNLPSSHPFPSRVVSRAPRSPDLAQPHRIDDVGVMGADGCCAPRL